MYITHDISDFFLAVCSSVSFDVIMQILTSCLDLQDFEIHLAHLLLDLISASSSRSGFTRHFINLKILWAVLTEFRTVGPLGADMGDSTIQMLDQPVTSPLLFLPVFRPSISSGFA